MKKSAIILLAVVPLVFSSCLFEQEDLFEESASERISDFMVEVKSVLESASNGWHCRYFPEPDQVYGGFNLFFKFEDGVVTMASEMNDPFITESSLYSFGEDLGVTLNFDTKNSILNYFIHPINNDYGLTYSGMEGDYSFTVVTATAEEVVLRGIRSGNTYVMDPIDEVVDWAEEMEVYLDNAVDMAFSSYYVVVNGKNYSCAVHDKRRLTISLDGDNSVSAPFIYTKTGISFYEPITIDGVTAQNFTFKGNYYFAEENGASFYVMTKTMVSDIEFTLKVPEDGLTYNSATVNVTPSADDEYYYLGVMTKSAFESYRGKKLLQKIIDEINNGIDSEEEAIEYAEENLRSGKISYRFDYPAFNTEYVAFAFGCGIYDDQLVFTTSAFTQEFTVSSDLLPSDAADMYKRWLGTWYVTSTSSRVNYTPFSFTILVKPGEVNSTYMVSGWGNTAYRQVYDIPLYYRASYSGASTPTVPIPACTGIMYYAGNKELGPGISNTGVECTVTSLNGLSKTSSLTEWYNIGSDPNGTTPSPAFVYDDDEEGYAITYNRYWSSAYEATTFDYFGTVVEGSTTSYYYLSYEFGTDYDHAIGPFSLVQLTDYEGNVIHTVDD